MIRKKKILMIIFMLAFFFMIGNVSAAEDKENSDSERINEEVQKLRDELAVKPVATESADDEDFKTS